MTTQDHDSEEGTGLAPAREERSLDRPIRLADEAPIRVGELLVQPGLLTVRHDDGREEVLQPRVMRVLVAMLTAGGAIVSRDNLLQSCWDGLIVGDDALNRVISRIRRLEEGIAADELKLETITRVGYRLLLKDARPAEPVREARPQRPLHSICVLPFLNMSNDPQQDYFSDGITEDIITDLSKVPSLFVVARTTSFALKGGALEVPTIARRLNVAHVLEGSVRRAGERVRITAQLTDGETGGHLWAERYDRELDDVFAIQDEVAKSVTQALGVTLGLAPAARAAGSTKDREAHDKYLRARALYRQQGPAELVRAIEIFREALALDPEFVQAWRGLFAAHVDALIYRAEPAELAFQGMAEAGAKIISLAPDAWWSHVLRADQYSHQHRWRDAEAAALAATAAASASEMDPAFTLSSVLASVGRVTEALEQAQRIRQADPLSMRASSFLQALLDFAGRRTEAQTEYERSRDLAGNREIPEFLAFLRALSRGEAEQAKVLAARAIEFETVPMPAFRDLPELCNDRQVMLERLRQVSGDPGYQDSTRRLKIAMLAGQYGDDALAMSALRRKSVDFAGGRISAIWHPAFARVRQSDDFKQMVGELGFPSYWRDSGRWGDFARPLGDDDFECF
jgi:TolB-like protein